MLAPAAATGAALGRVLMLLLALVTAPQRLLQPSLPVEASGEGPAHLGPCTRVMWLQDGTNSALDLQDSAGIPCQPRPHRPRLLTWQPPRLQPPPQPPLPLLP